MKNPLDIFFFLNVTLSKKGLFKKQNCQTWTFMSAKKQCVH